MFIPLEGSLRNARVVRTPYLYRHSDPEEIPGLEPDSDSDEEIELSDEEEGPDAGTWEHWEEWLDEEPETRRLPLEEAAGRLLKRWREAATGHSW